ncbi:endosome-associated-trafficking regulator 1 isoform X2 [Colius striatus]|uniref:endosome-associated-trafficking regulator 1 isoform X2 n=1 Tax=Colius striatus TaxID=57412 RepID=UPI002B1DF757|nr:endosome-associated-trafficking regulator 1 isoform X2 [Colius striatus]
MAAGELPAAGPAEPNPFSFREFIRSKARGAGGAPAAAAAQVGPGPEARPRRGAPPAPSSAALLCAPLHRRRGPARASAPSCSRSQRRPQSRTTTTRRRNGARATSPRPWSRLTSPQRRPPRPPPGPVRARRGQAAGTRAWPPAGSPRERPFPPCGSPATRRMRKLEKKLEENKIKEEKEAQDLEAMVQHVEQNLQLMTKRAVKAENSATKLKQENALLQVQLKNCQMENEALRSGQSASLAVVRQNADLALQNLLTVIASSRSSVNLSPLPLVLSLAITEHSLAPASSHPPFMDL